jgi:two-component system, sensor histidine kinase and response regulator
MKETYPNPLAANINTVDSVAWEANLSNSHEPRKSETTTVSAAVQSLHILVAEDNAVNQQIARRLLEKRGHTVVLVGDGRAAVDRLERESFDLVLMDVQMPVMDGVEATAAIRAREVQTGSWLPIVAMTAHAMKGDREKYLAAGMDGYISKPVQKQALWDVVEEFGAQKRLRSLQLGDPNGSSSPEDRSGQAGVPAPTDSGATAECAVFDSQAALERVEGDSDLLREMLAVFLENSEAMMDDIRRAASNQDTRGAERAAHALKGCLANLSANEAWQSAAFVERLGREGVFDGLAVACGQLESAMERLRPAMSALLEPVAC